MQAEADFKGKPQKAPFTLDLDQVNNDMEGQLRSSVSKKPSRNRVMASIEARSTQFSR